MPRPVLFLLVLLVAALALGAPPARSQAQGGLDIYFVDVEGGAATLIVTPAGESVLIDSGWPREDGRDARRIEHAARYRAGLTGIDHYVTTHWHTDHYGGIEALARLMPVRRFWDRGIPDRASDGAADFPTLIEAYRRAGGTRSRTLTPGERIPLRGRDLELLTVAGGGRVIGEGSEELPISCDRHRPAPVKDESDNRLSLGFLLRFGRFRFLNLGDLTWNIEHKLACPRNRIGKVDLWQVTHHGYEASGNPALIEAIRPRVAVMVNGPRKGASPRIVRIVKQAPSIQALYQLHRNVTSGPEDNTAPERIVNPEEKCNAEFLRARVLAGGERYEITKGAREVLGAYATR